MKTNNIKSSKNLKIGRKLTISGSGGTQSASSSGGTARNASVRANASASPSGVSGGTIKYKVQKEDTLWSLANRHNTTIDALVAINNLSGSSTIVAGQTLLIPRPAGAAQTEQQKSSGANEETVTYVVRKNDSLFEIALKYGVNYKDIMVWNKIKDHRKIVPGQRLVIRTKS